MNGIENWLPTFDVGERHEIVLALPPERALTRALAVPVAPDPLIKLLFRLRGFRPEGSIEQFLSANGFALLERTATSYVVGLFQPRIKIALDFRAEPALRGARLITETRVAAADASALLAFRVYWLIVGPFSALIRRRWLRSAAAATSNS